MYKMDRRERELLDMLLTAGMVTVHEIAERLGVSPPTARRLCVRLANENRAVRVRGGLKRLPASDAVYSFDSLRNEHTEEKACIARYASKLVQSNQTIFLEAGTTLRHFAIALAERIRNREINHVLIFTNSLVNLEILHPVQNNVQLIGGQYRDDRKDFTGYLSELALKDLRFDLCFIGADALSSAHGAMAMDMDTVRFDAQLVTHAEKTVILAHSAKFEKHSLISYVSLDQVDCIVTDDKIDKALVAEYQALHMNLVAVSD